MGAFDRIIKIVSESIKMNDRLISVSNQLKELAKDVRDIDKRLIRIETFAELAEKQKKLTKV